MYFLPLDNQSYNNLVFKASGHLAEGLSKAVSKRSHSSSFSSWLVHENLKSEVCSSQALKVAPSQSALRSFLLALSKSDPQAYTLRTPRSFNLTSPMYSA